MDSEESRPGSSASNSSSNSSDNSRPSSPTPKSPPANSATSPHSSGGRRSRPRSRASDEGGRSLRSVSKSDSNSSSSSSSSDNENEDAKSPGSPVQPKSKSSSDRSSVESNNDKTPRSVSRDRSVSPAKSQQSSRNSSSSSSHGGGAMNISHEDLSDVSDMESEKRASSFNNSKQSLDDEGTNTFPAAVALTEDEPIQVKRHFSLDADHSQDAVITDLRQKLDQKKNYVKATGSNTDKSGMSAGSTPNGNGNIDEPLEVLVKAHDEDALDFEAEEGECQDVSKDDDNITESNVGGGDKGKTSDDKSDGEAEEGEELEEGEVSDEDEKRPEETEPKPVCRFYTRGQCTWGMSCRFLHPGVTDKGNYTMFDLVRPVPVTQTGAASSRSANYAAHNADYHDYRNDRPPLHHRTAIHHPAAVYTAHHDARALIPEGPVVVESAWERGLRTAKEMMRKANRRKEQDMDFEDKKMNLTLSPDELEKDPYYIKERSPPDAVAPPYGRHAGGYQEVPSFARAAPIPTPFDEVDPYGRTTRYRELPPHRMPHYEDERRVRPTREVIVQRVESVGRGDEWNDPWMRRGGSQDRGEKRRRDRRSYSSNSSYSSSSSSQSDSSSDSSGSPSPADNRRRYNSGSHKSPPVARRHGVRAVRSPSPPARRSRRTPSILQSPTVKRRGHMSPSPILAKRGAYSPAHKRKKFSPNLKKTLNDKSKVKRRHTSSSSGSGSSDSSASDSDSDSGSSSSESSSRSRDRTPPKRSRASEKVVNDRKLAKKVKVDPPKKRSPISIEIKKQATVGASALASSPTHSVGSEKDSKKSRREELLKQLRAVEDAIAKKRSKLA